MKIGVRLRKFCETGEKVLVSLMSGVDETIAKMIVEELRD